MSQLFFFCEQSSSIRKPGYVPPPPNNFSAFSMKTGPNISVLVPGGLPAGLTPRPPLVFLSLSFLFKLCALQSKKNDFYQVALLAPLRPFPTLEHFQASGGEPYCACHHLLARFRLGLREKCWVSQVPATKLRHAFSVLALRAIHSFLSSS